MSHRLFCTLTGSAAVGLATATIVTALSAAQPTSPPREAAAKAAPTIPKWNGPPCDSCEALSALEEQLFQQELLRDEFQKYASKEKFPVPPDGYTKVRKTPQGLEVSGTATDFMVDSVTAAFQAYLDSPAGGGSGGVGQAELGTDTDTCKLVLYVKGADGKNVRGRDGQPVTKPFDEKKYREDLACEPVADFVLTHERQHIADCSGESLQAVGGARARGIDRNEWADFAAYDARGYQAGIASLRKSIAALAMRCGWQGSTNPTKPDGSSTVPTPEQAKDLGRRPTVPTKDQIKSLTDALRRGGGK
jgi:hypothetical protein